VPAPPFCPAEKLDSVQVLRAVAAVAVVTHHIVLFGNGAWGVDLFFVISGFIMCFVTERSGRNFFAKRVIRVVPLYWAGTLGLFCVALLLPGLLRETRPDLMQLLKSLFFIPYQNRDGVYPIMFLGWTLNYEMFFYVLFALSMAISHAYRALICSAMLGALALVGWRLDSGSVVVEFYTSPILVEFALGMFCHWAFVRSAPWRARGVGTAARVGMGLAGTLLIASMPSLADDAEDVGRLVVWGLPASAAFLLLVHALSNKRLPRPAVLVGDASYSLYLFHPYVLNVLNRLFAAYASEGALAWAFAFAKVVVCCAVAIALYRLLEVPMTSWLRSVFLSRSPRGTGEGAPA